MNVLIVLKMKCCKCSDELSAAYGECLVQKQTREAQRYRMINKVWYAEAVRKVNGQTEHLQQCCSDLQTQLESD